MKDVASSVVATQKARSQREQSLQAGTVNLPTIYLISLLRTGHLRMQFVTFTYLCGPWGTRVGMEKWSMHKPPHATGSPWNQVLHWAVIQGCFQGLFSFSGDAHIPAMTGVAQWFECHPANRKVAGLIPGQGTCLGCGPGPPLGLCERTPVYVSLICQCFSPSLSPSLSLSLKINKIFLKREMHAQVFRDKSHDICNLLSNHSEGIIKGRKNRGMRERRKRRRRREGGRRRRERECVYIV